MSATLWYIRTLVYPAICSCTHLLREYFCGNDYTKHEPSSPQWPFLFQGAEKGVKLGNDYSFVKDANPVIIFTVTATQFNIFSALLNPTICPQRCKVQPLLQLNKETKLRCKLGCRLPVWYSIPAGIRLVQALNQFSRKKNSARNPWLPIALFSNNSKSVVTN